jgi:hypothetical protein
MEPSRQVLSQTLAILALLEITVYKPQPQVPLQKLPAQKASSAQQRQVIMEDIPARSANTILQVDSNRQINAQTAQQHTTAPKKE